LSGLLYFYQMSKTGNFKKFVQKKKNSVIKEEFRKEKKEWKKELTEKRLQKKKLTRANAPSSKSPSPKPQGVEHIAGAIPLNKFISHSGTCGRREAAELVKAGKVLVDGKLITEPGFKVTSDQEIKLNGKKLFCRRTSFTFFSISQKIS